MFTPQPMYQVWSSTGNGLRPGPRFRLLEDAIRYVLVHRDHASHAIMRPDRSWLAWDGLATIIRRDPAVMAPARRPPR